MFVYVVLYGGIIDWKTIVSLYAGQVDNYLTPLTP